MDPVALAFVFFFNFYQLRDSISGDTKLTTDIGLRDASGAPSAVSGLGHGDMTFFTLADLKVGGNSFHLDENGSFWNANEAQPPVGQPVSSSKIVIKSGTQGTIDIRDVKPVQYLVPVTDDSRDSASQKAKIFELKEADMRTGVILDVTVVPESNEKLAKFGFEPEIYSLLHREPVAGTTLEVGKPNIASRGAGLALNLEIGRPYGVLWFTERGTTLITMAVGTESTSRNPLDPGGAPSGAKVTSVIEIGGSGRQSNFSAPRTPASGPTQQPMPLTLHQHDESHLGAAVTTTTAAIKPGALRLPQDAPVKAAAPKPSPADSAPSVIASSDGVFANWFGKYTVECDTMKMVDNPDQPGGPQTAVFEGDVRLDAEDFKVSDCGKMIVNNGANTIEFFGSGDKEVKLEQNGAVVKNESILLEALPDGKFRVTTTRKGKARGDLKITN